MVNQQLKDEADPTPPLHLPSRGHSKSSHNPHNSLATRVAAKLKDGDYKGAVRLACSEDSIATFDEETLAALRSKHPPPHPLSQIPPPPPEDSTPSTTISVEAVAKAILSFPNGSAGGPDGLSPQHLKDLISASAEKGGRDLLWALTSFVNLVLSGKTPPPVRPTFFGASLIALRKKDGGIRPIAVGHTLRRLAAKCIGSTVQQSMGAYLAPLQLGYGTPSGAEAAAHAARLYLQNAQANHLMLKLDFKNAFNCLRRDKMLEAVGKAAPELLPFVHSAYEKSSSLSVEAQSCFPRKEFNRVIPSAPSSSASPSTQWFFNSGLNSGCFIWMTVRWVVACLMFLKIFSWWRVLHQSWAYSLTAASQS